VSVLVVAAHPDDEILGCGATAAKLRADGVDVHFAILGEGITSRDGKDASAAGELEELHSAAHAAAELVGVSSVSLHNLPDNKFDSLPLLEVVKVVEAIVAQTKPEVIYTHHPGDLNIDHTVTCRAVLTATRPMAGVGVRDVYCFEVPSSTEWSFGMVAPAFAPNVFVDVSDFVDQKIAAMSAYRSEARPAPHPRSAEALRAAATRWGSYVGYMAAEPFQLVRSLR
jgi:LmbE family N-acetylglucosaminyl deacetylase